MGRLWFKIYIYIVVSCLVINSCKEKDDIVKPDKKPDELPVSYVKDTMLPFTFVQLNKQDFFSLPQNLVSAPNGRILGYAFGQLKMLHPGSFVWNNHSNSDVNNGLGLHFGKDGKGYVFGNKVNFLISADNGINWIAKNHIGLNLNRTLDGYWIRARTNGDIFVCLLVSSQYELYLSTDGGNNFQTLALPPLATNENIRECMIGPDEQLIISSLKKIYTTNDEGKNWTNPLSGNSIRDLYFQKNGVLFYNDETRLFKGNIKTGQTSFIGSFRVINGELANGNLVAGNQRSEDGGLSWLPMGNGPGGIVTNNRIVGIKDGKTYILEDGSTEWTFTGMPVGNCVEYLKFEHIHVFASDKQIYTSRDKGNTWRIAFQFDIERIEHIAWMPSNNTFAVSTHFMNLYLFDHQMSNYLSRQIFSQRIADIHWYDKERTMFVGFGDDPKLTGTPKGAVYYQLNFGGWNELSPGGYINCFLDLGDLLYVYHKEDKVSRTYLPGGFTKWEEVRVNLVHGFPIGSKEYPLCAEHTWVGNLNLILGSNNILFAERLISKTDSKYELFTVNNFAQLANVGKVSRFHFDEQGFVMLMTNQGLFRSNEKAIWLR